MCLPCGTSAYKGAPHISIGKYKGEYNREDLSMQSETKGDPIVFSEYCCSTYCQSIMLPYLGLPQVNYRCQINHSRDSQLLRDIGQIKQTDSSFQKTAVRSEGDKTLNINV